MQRKSNATLEFFRNSYKIHHKLRCIVQIVFNSNEIYECFICLFM